MHRIQTFNAISELGLKKLQKDCFEVGPDLNNADAILLRSYKLEKESITNELKAVARAGAGVNNVPVDTCTEKGVVVFNTPGANANAVKELVFADYYSDREKSYLGSVLRRVRELLLIIMSCLSSWNLRKNGLKAMK